jgi:hypothetical protein
MGPPEVVRRPLVPPPPRLLLFCCCLLFGSASSTKHDEVSGIPPETVHIVAQYPNNASQLLFNHLVLDPKTGQIFAGAVNRLLQLDSELRLKELLITGNYFLPVTFYTLELALLLLSNFGAMLLLQPPLGRGPNRVSHPRIRLNRRT